MLARKISQQSSSCHSILWPGSFRYFLQCHSNIVTQDDSNQQGNSVRSNRHRLATLICGGLSVLFTERNCKHVVFISMSQQILWRDCLSTAFSSGPQAKYCKHVIFFVHSNISLCTRQHPFLSTSNMHRWPQ